MSALPRGRRARGGSVEPVEPGAVPGASPGSSRLPHWDVSHILVPLQCGARAAAPKRSVGSTGAGLGNRGDTARSARPQYGSLPTWKSPVLNGGQVLENKPNNKSLVYFEICRGDGIVR